MESRSSAIFAAPGLAVKPHLVLRYDHPRICGTAAPQVAVIPPPDLRYGTLEFAVLSQGCRISSSGDRRFSASPAGISEPSSRKSTPRIAVLRPPPKTTQACSHEILFPRETRPGTTRNNVNCLDSQFVFPWETRLRAPKKLPIFARLRKFRFPGKLRQAAPETPHFTQAHKSLFPWETYIPGNAYYAPRVPLVDTARNGSKIASLRMVVGPRKGGPLPLPVGRSRIPLEA